MTELFERDEPGRPLSAYLMTLLLVWAYQAALTSVILI
jgi:hypothetical protein